MVTDTEGHRERGRANRNSEARGRGRARDTKEVGWPKPERGSWATQTERPGEPEGIAREGAEMKQIGKLRARASENLGQGGSRGGGGDAEN